jgi:hypothetical protein
MSNKKGRDKFDYAITGIFLCAIIVSFNHTIDLYKSAGFDVPVQVLSSIVDYFFGKGESVTLALFATIAAEAAFSVGLWGLYEAFKIEREFPSISRYKSTWLVFAGGLLVIGWSNVGGSLGFNYLFGNPIKGYILGLSMPYFVLNSVLVNFSRTYKVDRTDTVQTEQPGWKKWLKTAQEIKSEVSTLVGSNKLNEQTEHHTLNTEHDTLYTEQTKSNTIQNEQIEQTKLNIEHGTMNTVQTEQIEHRTTNTEQVDKLNNVHNQTNTIERAPLYVVQPNRTDKTEQTEQLSTVQNVQTEQNVQPLNKTKLNTVQNEHDTLDTEQTEHRTLNIEQTEQLKLNNRTNKTEQANIVQLNKPNKRNKTEQAVQYVSELIEQNIDFTTRSVASVIGCSPSTASAAINRAKQMVQ